MPKIFERLGFSKPQKSAFDLSHDQKLTCNFGELVPTYLQEILPGDEFHVKSELMLRLAPMIAPVMHRVNVTMHYFFVPNRIIWSEWENFITGGQDGTAAPALPSMSMSFQSQGRLSDYLGIPVGSGNDAPTTISTLTHRAYQKIWSDYYRDPNLDAEVTDANMLDKTYLNTMRYRGYEKDYFTSALPWSQRGPAVGMPVSIDYLPTSNIYTAAGNSPSIAGANLTTGTTPNPSSKIQASGDALRVENIDETALEFTINDLRTSSALQRWLEKQARGGARYAETLLSHFGVKSSDSRLQRPEYLGGGMQPVSISEVLQTSEDGTSPLGSMAGHGISVGTTNQFKKTFEEHGYVMGIMSILPKTAYQNGIPKHFLRTDKTDYFWPEFANLGEQAITNEELFYTNNNQALNKATFGYQQRYAEYKYQPNTVHGLFRTDSYLQAWHMGRIFSSLPTLSSAFTTYPATAAPDARVWNVTTGDKVWLQMYHNVKARRPMPYFANPSLR